MRIIKKGFTTSELLVVLSVIAVIMTLMLSGFANKINKHKAMFKKGYSTLERITWELVNDELLYPYSRANFGLLETTNVRIPDTDSCIFGNYEENKGCKGKIRIEDNISGNKDKAVIMKYCKLVSNSINRINYKELPSGKGCSFTTADNIGWILEYPVEATVVQTTGETVTGEDQTTKRVKGILATIDTTNDKGPNIPAQFKETENNKCSDSADEYCKELEREDRDRFFVIINTDGKIELPAYDKILAEYVYSGNFNRSKEEKDDE